MRRIALIAGGGRLPVIFADEAKKAGEYVVALAIKGLTSPELERRASKIYWGEITETKRALEVLKAEKLDYIVMTGKIPKTVIFDKKLHQNKDASEVFEKAIDWKDYSIIKAVAAVLNKEGIRIMDPTLYFKKLLPEKGIIAGAKPTDSEWADIRFGYNTAKRLAGLDIGQTVVVKKKSVLAVEAMEGTDSAIRRAAQLNGEGAVVVKVARPRQDMRFDIPTIGPETIDSLIAAKAAVLAVEAKKTLVVDKEEIIKKSEAAGIKVVAV